MLPSRIDTLSAPTGARRAPFVAFAMVITVVLAMLVIGLSEWGWLIALLVPVLALTGYIVLNTIRVMIADSKE